MVFDEEILIDEEVKDALDQQVLSWKSLTSGKMFGGASYHVNGDPFAVLLEGVVAAGLPQELRMRALTLAGVSPFRPPAEDRELEEWVQFVILLEDDVPAVVPWLEAAYNYVASLPERTKRGKTG